MSDMLSSEKYAECLCREMASPVGRLALYAGEESLLAIEFIGTSADSSLCQGDSAILLETERQLLAYFSGRLTVFNLPLLPLGTDFQISVWQAMRQIPFGVTRTYGEIAEKVGSKNKARAVGQAANKNPLPIVIPCHRVVGAGNRLTGFAPGIDKKAILLNHEQGVGIWCA
ncbi:MAG: methylated-DNA--[protein]-cysteine S-methyltransferase [Desulfoprunum sp.]|nr:methylated-DNA--[protein]-cysteine S-methyltransferase [Desulfoprunum sp.]